MKAEEIKDEESLKAWLTPRSRENAIAIAVRAALRVFPLVGRGWHGKAENPVDSTVIHVLWALVVAGAARRFFAQDVRYSAFSSAFSRPAFYKDDDERTLAAAGSATAAFNAAQVVGAANEHFHDAAVSASVGGHAEAFAANAIQSPAIDFSWQEFCSDARLLDRGEDPFTAPLWSTAPP